MSAVNVCNKICKIGNITTHAVYLRVRWNCSQSSEPTWNFWGASTSLEHEMLYRKKTNGDIFRIIFFRLHQVKELSLWSKLGWCRCTNKEVGHNPQLPLNIWHLGDIVFLAIQRIFLFNEKVGGTASINDHYYKFFKWKVIDFTYLIALKCTSNFRDACRERVEQNVYLAAVKSRAVCPLSDVNADNLLVHIAVSRWRHATASFFFYFCTYL